LPYKRSQSPAVPHCITSAIEMGADARNQFRLQVGMKRADLGSQKTQVSPTTATPAWEGFHG
jgi:hypothetical protein